MTLPDLKDLVFDQTIMLGRDKQFFDEDVTSHNRAASNCSQVFVNPYNNKAYFIQYKDSQYGCRVYEGKDSTFSVYDYQYIFEGLQVAYELLVWKVITL